MPQVLFDSLPDVNNGSTDAAELRLNDFEKTNFTCANVGAKYRYTRVTDVNGNSATETAIVTVEDKKRCQ
jgi:hypothetical protein